MVNVIKDRDDRILNAAVELAQESGYASLTRDAVARRAGVSDGSVSNAFGTVDALKAAVLRAAVARGLVVVIAQGLADKHPETAALPATLRTKVAAHLLAG
jgi:AcrR family transcriptional regulator